MSIHSGNAGNAAQSTPTAAIAELLFGSSERMSSMQPAGQTSVATARFTALTAAGIATSAEAATSEVTPCHPAG